MVRSVAKQRRSPDGGVMYVGGGIKATAVPINDDSSLYIQARNALRIDLANHLNLPVALLDGSPATASLTYSTGEGKRSEFDDLSVDYWTTPIQAAFSQDSVVPRGTRIRFDFASRYAATNAPTGAPTLD
jgi:phage portal protein BeeE